MIVASVFNDLIVQPIFNLLVFIYALLPGHNFGLAIIIFTVVVRLLMWPLVKKQLHHTKALRAMQPEIKRIKAASKGDRQKESLMLMELYKERQISPFGSFGIIIVQFIILIGLYQGLRKVVIDPRALIDFSYSWLHDTGWLKTLANDIGKFDASLFGFIDLKRSAIGETGGIYWPAMFIVIGSAVTQYYSSKQLMPDDKNAKSLRSLLKDASTGKQAEKEEVNAATGRMMRYLLPGFIFLFTIGIASAISLYWFVSGLVAYLQQGRILKEDEEEMEEIADEKTEPTDKKEVIEGEVIESTKPKPKKKKQKQGGKKRRKR